ncbi:glutathione S-transferase family protein [Archangium violaceum]|uniref:glutathione S-transferase family protein n=1 Tax=Archangium violaceum TaxID=83451 RepID=UPI001952623B|nr:glutathione S-transferase family protein [Archangium violaceum]QRN92802.1 glutathione S-transferase family protein [Archangium violaceum]
MTPNPGPPPQLYFHPFASFCQKVLVALYENGTPFEPHFVDLGDPASRQAFLAIWPVGKMPVLVDRAANRTIPESSIIIEYLDRHYPGATRLIPDDFDKALETRLQDRFFDLQIAEPMQKIVTDRIRPKGRGDPHGVEAARASLRTAYDLLDRQMATRTWAVGEAFTLADCGAAPALFYANWVEPITHAHVRAYLDRLMKRPSFARAVEEARPYRVLFPQPRTDD